MKKNKILKRNSKIISLIFLTIMFIPFEVFAGEQEGPCYAAGGKTCEVITRADGTKTIRCDDMVYYGIGWTDLCTFSCDDKFNLQSWDIERGKDPKFFYQHCYKDDELHSEKLAKCREIHGAHSVVAGGKCACEKYYGPDSSRPYQCVLVGQKCEPTIFYIESRPTETVCRCPSGASLGPDGVTCFPDSTQLNNDEEIQKSTQLVTPHKRPWF